MTIYRWLSTVLFFLSTLLYRSSNAFSLCNRRQALVLASIATIPTSIAHAAADCFADCYKNCQLIAPKDTTGYCTDNCRDYCSQSDRTDGLSGSVSAASGEVGILGGTFGQGTVVKGNDKPPGIALPGLNFNTDSGKKLIGY